MSQRERTASRYPVDSSELVTALEILANLIYLARIAPEGDEAQRFVALADEQIERVFVILHENVAPGPSDPTHSSSSPATD